VKLGSESDGPLSRTSALRSAALSTMQPLLSLFVRM
jgi:hypothetical protein